MNINRMAILATCIAVGLAAVSGPSLAKKRNTLVTQTANAASEGYPNGRPWQAMAYDFTVLMNQLDILDAKVDTVDGKVDTVDDKVDVLDEKVDAVKADTEEIIETLDGVSNGLDSLGETVDGIAADVATLKNTLEVQVSVVPDADRNSDTDSPVTLFVQVSQNGDGVEGLGPEAFSYENSFPDDAAGYCGAGCFTAGSGGVYSIVLEGDWEAASYAGSLDVEHMLGDMMMTTAHGTSLVSFTVPAAPIVEP